MPIIFLFSSGLIYSVGFKKHKIASTLLIIVTFASLYFTVEEVFIRITKFMSSDLYNSEVDTKSKPNQSTRKLAREVDDAAVNSAPSNHVSDPNPPSQANNPTTFNPKSIREQAAPETAAQESNIPLCTETFAMKKINGRVCMIDTSCGKIFENWANNGCL